jgi:hypothetical protein
VTGIRSGREIANWRRAAGGGVAVGRLGNSRCFSTLPTCPKRQPREGSRIRRAYCLIWARPGLGLTAAHHRAAVNSVTPRKAHARGDPRRGTDRRPPRPANQDRPGRDHRHGPLVRIRHKQIGFAVPADPETRVDLEGPEDQLIRVGFNAIVAAAARACVPAISSRRSDIPRADMGPSDTAPALLRKLRRVKPLARRRLPSPF